MDTIFQVMTLAWSIQGGVLPGIAMADSAENVLNVAPAFYAEYGFELSYPIFSGRKSDENGIYFGTTVQNEFINTGNGVQIASIQDTYTVSAGIRWNELTIGFDHACTHSVESLVKGQLITQTLFGTMDRIFVKLAGKI